MANAAGIGGGVLFVPIFNALVGFTLKASTALSQSTMVIRGFRGLGGRGLGVMVRQ